MSRWYLDTSAAAKLIAEEAESAALASELDSRTPDLVACYLLETELRRFVQRGARLAQSMATEVLDSVDLYEVPPSLFQEAGLLVGNLRSLDAIHIASAIRIGADAIVTYDERMITAARDVGLPSICPGAVAV